MVLLPASPPLLLAVSGCWWVWYCICISSPGVEHQQINSHVCHRNYSPHINYPSNVPGLEFDLQDSYDSSTSTLLSCFYIHSSLTAHERKS
ncbi:hypothetical protein An15g00180 [Aspergillus niger]|uniref:Secreted protein n=2 Tax=Aspergillus niger TaxID=5061 RepID=A2R4E9_ASPNC|nr:hypothetical protein An15g00180 [Aspergillus niger]CAK42187.1 hypothetical protein An15g00180 [Aspergillus niger]